MASWLNPEQAADISGYSTKTIYRALWSGELVGSQRRRRWRIRPDALTEWIEGDQSIDSQASTAPRARRISPRIPATPRGSLGKLLNNYDSDAA